MDSVADFGGLRTNGYFRRLARQTRATGLCFQTRLAGLAAGFMVLHRDVVVEKFAR